MSVIFDELLIEGAVVFDLLEYQGPDNPIIGGTAVHAHEATPGYIAPAGPISTRRVVRIAA